MRDAAGELGDVLEGCVCLDELRLEELALGYVAPDEQVAARHDRRREGELNGAFAAFRQKDQLAFVLPGSQACGPSLRDPRRGCRVEERFDGNGRQRVGRNLQHRAGRRIGIHQPPLVVDHQQRVERVVEDRAELLIALAQHQLRLQAEALLLVQLACLLVDFLEVPDPIGMMREPGAHRAVHEHPDRGRGEGPDYPEVCQRAPGAARRVSTSQLIAGTDVSDVSMGDAIGMASLH